MLSESSLIVNVISPKTDIYDTNPAGAYINMKYANKVTFLLAQKTAGTNTGTATITVLAATSNGGAGAEAIEFKYRKKTTGASVVYGNVVDATTAGFTTTANEDTIYEIEVEAAKLPETKPYVTIKLTEAVNDPVTGGVCAILHGARFQSQTQPDVLA